MISLNASHGEKPELRVHGGRTLQARAGGSMDVTWLELENEIGDIVVVFLPEELSHRIAQAINTIHHEGDYDANRPV